MTVGNGGPLATTFPLSPVALEQAGTLLEREVSDRKAPWTATVRWIGVRTAQQSV